MPLHGNRYLAFLSTSKKTGDTSVAMVAQYEFNLGIVPGGLQTGSGAHDAYKQSAYLGVPLTEHFGLKGQGFKVVENVPGKSLESVTKHSCREAVAVEIWLTKEAQARCEAAADMAATAAAAAAAA